MNNISHQTDREAHSSVTMFRLRKLIKSYSMKKMEVNCEIGLYFKSTK